MHPLSKTAAAHDVRPVGILPEEAASVGAGEPEKFMVDASSCSVDEMLVM